MNKMKLDGNNKKFNEIDNLIITSSLFLMNPSQEAPDNTKPRDLPPNTWYTASVWGKDRRLLAGGRLRITDAVRPDCDGIFEIIDQIIPVNSQSLGIAISVGNFQIDKILPVDPAITIC